MNRVLPSVNRDKSTLLRGRWKAGLVGTELFVVNADQHAGEHLATERLSMSARTRCASGASSIAHVDGEALAALGALVGLLVGVSAALAFRVSEPDSVAST